MVTDKPRLLIKSKALPKGIAFNVGKANFTIEPLFAHTPIPEGMGLDAGSRWHVAELVGSTDEADVWDLCHQLQSGGMGFAAAPEVEFAEPDLEQKWSFDSSMRQAVKGFQAAISPSCARPDPPDNRFPAPSPFQWNWFQDPTHSGLAAARDAIGNPENRITIAHLDTGYREGHTLLPVHLDTAVARSFVEGDPDPKSAVDPGVDGLGKNPGHGTGTLGILAGHFFKGSPFGDPDGIVGGASFARIVPVRVANSVVLFSNSAIARGIEYAISQGAHVLSMSMGGVPSRAWADIVNRAYEEGLTLVTAAGNNFGPGRLRVPRFIVYPARFRRVLAACGVMWNGKPYADFGDPRMMGGSYGPDSKMDTAIAAYTPNSAWADFDCTALVDYDGSGTSSATPQVAAAAACWIQKNLADIERYPEKWMRVEAVRKALLESASNTDREHFGKGTLRAAEALGIEPPDAASLKKQSPDKIHFPLFGPITDAIFGAAPSNRIDMFHTEAAQILARNGELQRILIDASIDPDQPSAEIPGSVRRQIVDAIAADPSVSKALKSALAAPITRDRPIVPVGDIPQPLPAESPAIPAPAMRRLRVFAFDPTLGLRVDTESLNETTLEVPWEPDLQPGPIGEYLEVVDVDPASDACYAPVDLNHSHLLASDGHAPSEGVPQFHQQMVYAVAMTTIGRFEEALGRTALWAPRRIQPTKPGEKYRSYYVQRLRVYPHALREANAFYSPLRNALLFGYFQANRSDAGDNLPGGMVFTCLSHDVIAHETTHALVDGLHRYYQIQSNPDIAAFHEAFADIVALFQHFSMPAALQHTIARSQGDLRKNNLLADLAQQFGQASSGSRALRSALKDKPTPNDYNDATEAHDRGAVLLAAVFQAFLEIYDARVADLKRLATGGTGVLPRGAIPTDLVHRMAQEASTAASHVLLTCIRALDYCPPVDLTFGDYLRAIITADVDVEPEDTLNYRTAFVSGFRARGIYPGAVRSLSEQTLRWQPPTVHIPKGKIREMLSNLDLSWNLSTNRCKAYETGEANGKALWRWLQTLKPDESAALGRDLGVYLTAETVDADKERLKNVQIPRSANGLPKLQIHSVRPARRISRRRQQTTDLVIEAVQRCIYTDPETQVESEHRGGCTILVDLENERIRYAIRKRVGQSSRIQAEKSFFGLAAEGSQGYFDTTSNREPFAMLHRGI